MISSNKGILSVDELLSNAFTLHAVGAGYSMWTHQWWIQSWAVAVKSCRLIGFATSSMARLMQKTTKMLNIFVKNVGRLTKMYNYRKQDLSGRKIND